MAPTGTVPADGASTEATTEATAEASTAPTHGWAQGPLAGISGVADQQYPPGLYVVATPLGNAADVSVRALWVLAHADLVACEDTRTSGLLLSRFGIAARRVALHRHNERAALEPILARLHEGARVALVSDAGTPAVCDPGAVLVRAALDAGVRVLPVPGPSSLLAALSAAGIESAGFRFLGFAPSPARQRARFWQEVAACPVPVVVFETPHRILDSAADIAAAMEPDRRIVVARELTKQFEQVFATTAGALVQRLSEGSGRGEFVLVFDARAQQAVGAHEPDAPAIDATTARWLEALAGELSPSRLAAAAARASGLPREQLYRALCARAAAGGAADPANEP